ncbi:MAG: TolB protein [Flavobacteriales bacterium]|jgi:TolB protein
MSAKIRTRLRQQAIKAIKAIHMTILCSELSFTKLNLLWPSAMNLRLPFSINCMAVVVSTLLLAANSHAELFFSSRTMGPATNIYSVTHGGAVHRITNDAKWRDMAADISPGGDVVFMSNRKSSTEIDLNQTSDELNVFLLNTEDSKNRYISTPIKLSDGVGKALYPQYSPDGKNIAYLKKTHNKMQLIVRSVENKTDRIIIDQAKLSQLSWTPDGQHISFVEYDKVHSYLNIISIVDGINQRLLTFSNGERDVDSALSALVDLKSNMRLESAQWSPRGDKVALVVLDLSNNERKLFSYDISSKIFELLSVPGMQVQYPVSWSPKGGQLLYSALENYKFFYDENIHQKMYKGGMQIFLSTIGEGTKQLSSGDVLHSRPVFSPDAKHVAFFFSPNLGARKLALHTMSVDGSERKSLYENVAQDSFLVWH